MGCDDIEVGVYDYAITFSEKSPEGGWLISNDPSVDIREFTNKELEALGEFVLAEMKRREKNE